MKLNVTFGVHEAMQCYLTNKSDSRAEEIASMDGPYRATKLWNEMLHTFCHGMPLRRHRRHMKVYEESFTGAEAVNWLLVALKSNPNIEPSITKSQVRQLLDKFMKAGIFCIVSNSGDASLFKENDLYVFCVKPGGEIRSPLLHNMFKGAEKKKQDRRGDIIDMKVLSLSKHSAQSENEPEWMYRGRDKLVAPKGNLREMQYNAGHKCSQKSVYTHILNSAKGHVLDSSGTLQTKNIYLQPLKEASNASHKSYECYLHATRGKLNADLTSEEYASDRCSSQSATKLTHEDRVFPGEMFLQQNNVHERWRTIFLRRLRVLLAGVEELAALLPPTSLPLDWLLHNVRDGWQETQDEGAQVSYMEAIESVRDDFIDTSEPLISVQLYNIITQSFLYWERKADAAAVQAPTPGLLAAAGSVEQLVLGMASPAPLALPVPLLPPNLCFETAFTSDEPVTRIVEQQAVDTLHLPRRPRARGRVASVTRGFSFTTGEAGRRVDWRARSQNREACDVGAAQRARKQHRGRVRLMHGRENLAFDDSDQGTLEHCRNKSGGYVNPALSKSIDNASSEDLASEELDYAFALASLQNLMKHAYASSQEDADKGQQGQSVCNSTCDLSSESGSYYTATSTPDREHLPTHAKPVRESARGDIEAGAQSAWLLRLLRLLLLLAAPRSRAALRRLLHCLHRLPHAAGAWDAAQITYSLTPNILCSQSEAEYDRQLAFRVVNFLVCHYADILKVPPDLAAEVSSCSPSTGKVSYCQQVTSQQFEQQSLTASQLALSELLEQILSDIKMTDKERKRKIKLFRESYPHIYKRRFPDWEDGGNMTSEKSRGLFPSLHKLRSLRI